MELKTYHNLDDKSKVFGGGRHIIIDTKVKFDDWYNEQLEKEKGFTKKAQEISEQISRIKEKNERRTKFLEDFLKHNNHTPVYRGVNESKYKLYSSAQRLLLTHELEKDGIDLKTFIRREIEELQSNKTLSAFWKKLNITPSDLLCLAFLQHYGAATPLLDFSKSLKVALYFMQDNLSYPISGSDNDIDNYCSLYYQDLRRDLDVMLIYLNGAENADKHLSELKKQYPDAIISTDDVAHELESFNIDKLYDPVGSSLDTLWLDNTSEFYTSDSLGITLSTVITNLNLEAQKGCFVINLRSKEPYEDSHLHCADIHKSLIPYIRDKYLTDIKRQEIYPQEEQIAQVALNKALI